MYIEINHISMITPVFPIFPPDKMDSKEAENEIRNNWNNPLSTISFLSAAKLYDHFNGVLKRKQIEKILSGFESYSLQKEEKSTGSIFEGFSLPTHIDNIIEIDSFQINELSASNLDVAHILCGINTFSKRLYAVPLINRDAKSGLEAIKQIFRLSKTLPDFIVSDQVLFKKWQRTSVHNFQCLGWGVQLKADSRLSEIQGCNTSYCDWSPQGCQCRTRSTNSSKKNLHLFK